MRNLKLVILLSFLTLCLENTHAQTTDSLSIAPNPFSVSTTIHFELVESDTITLRVFNNLGHTVKTFFNATILPAGTYNINFLGDSLASGVYFVRLEIGSTKTITKTAIKTGTAGISNNNLANQVLIYPNPTTDLMTIAVEGKNTIIVSDLNGRTIQTFTNNEKVISLADYPSGQYLIHIVNGKNEIFSTSKVVKID